MDVLARAGYDVWAVDARGFGGSTRMIEMEEPPEGGVPLTPALTAARDLAAAVDFIRLLLQQGLTEAYVTEKLAQHAKSREHVMAMLVVF